MLAVLQAAQGPGGQGPGGAAGGAAGATATTPGIPATPPEAEPEPAPARAARQRLERRDNLPRFLGGTAWQGLGRVGDRLSRWMAPKLDRMADQPVPGGLLGMFLLNLAFLLAVVPANAQGYTRLQLLWLTLLNQTMLPESVTPQVVPDSALMAAATAGVVAVDHAATAVGDVARALGGVVTPAATAAAGLAGVAGSLPPWVQGALGGVAGALTHQSFTPPSQANPAAPPPPPTVTI